MSDLIRREAAKEYFDLYRHSVLSTDEIISMIPANVPDTNVGDMISRQAAIDACLKGKADGLPATNVACDCCAERIRVLPSAQSEQRWIPCSERLPEESGRYLISVLDGVGRRTTVAPYQPRYKAWTMTGRMAYWKVIAWMPLPEPYKDGEQDG